MRKLIFPYETFNLKIEIIKVPIVVPVSVTFYLGPGAWSAWRSCVALAPVIILYLRLGIFFLTYCLSERCASAGPSCRRDNRTL